MSFKSHVNAFSIQNLQIWVKDHITLESFFTLVIALSKKTANKRAVCNFCIKEYTFLLLQ